ncbi:MAG: hypothetical protein KKF41_04340 [Actinobacteria bacterium]|nr:hypothetical protein [Actinomycetota bacterium]MBU1943439.1 hypothetical protein [Actinomycetota bacterium]MBU2686796.1 hypothetical protein [Actinomycetota bacterium]
MKRLVPLAAAVLIAALSLAGCNTIEDTLREHTYGLLDVFALDQENVWAVGTRGMILRWDGGRFVPQESGTAVDLHGVSAASPRDVWAVGDGGTVLHCDGTAWKPVLSPTDRDLADVTAVAGASGTDLWAVGGGGTVVRYSSGSWTVENPVDWELSSIAAAGGRVLAGGERGVLAYTGTWGLELETPEPVSAVAASGDGRAWAASHPLGTYPVMVSTIFACDPAAGWGPVYRVADTAVRGLAAVGPRDVYASCDHGVVVRFDGASWSRESVSVYETYAAVSGASPERVWVVGMEVGTRWVSLPVARESAGGWHRVDTPMFVSGVLRREPE